MKMKKKNEERSGYAFTYSGSRLGRSSRKDALLRVFPQARTPMTRKSASFRASRLAYANEDRSVPL